MISNLCGAMSMCLKNFVGTPIHIKQGLTWLRLRNLGVDNPVNFEICSRHPLIFWRKACSSHVAVEFLEALQVPKPSSTCSTATTSAGTAQLGEIFVGVGSVGSWPWRWGSNRTCWMNHQQWSFNEINSDQDFLQHNYIPRYHDNISLASVLWGDFSKDPREFLGTLSHVRFEKSILRGLRWLGVFTGGLEKSLINDPGLWGLHLVVSITLKVGLQHRCLVVPHQRRGCKKWQNSRNLGES